MSQKWFIAGVVAILTGGFSFLISIYPDEVRKTISAALNIPDATIVFYVLVFLVGLALLSSVGYIIYLIYRRLKTGVKIKRDSLRFNKYPYLLVDSQQRFQQMPNMVYAEITVENPEDTKVEECEVEIILRKENVEIYKSKVLSADSTKEPNPMVVSVDANGGTTGFHPLCLKLETLEAFLPNHSLGVAGVFSGTLVSHGEYELLGKVIFDQKQSKIISLGNVKIPNDFLEKAGIPNDVQVMIDQGGFAIYLEHSRERVRAKFYGRNNDDDTKRVILNHLERIPNINEIIEDNGRLRRWEITTTIVNGGIRHVNLIDVRE
jgi:hypothetical protein